MASIDQPQQQDDLADGSFSPGVRHGGRHAAPTRRADAPRFPRRRRWPVAAAVAALAVLVVPPATPSAPVLTANASEDTEPPGGLTAAETISFLSAGAPSGSIVLSSAPAQVGDQAPIAPTVISGLAANGIPNVALNAYRVAAARMGNSKPSCGIDWSLLAGIGRVETNHGRFRGAVLNSDGTSTPRIMGPPLDGVQFAFIRDTDGGSWDGDRTFDRAVGPMQFIPATWRAYGVDADGSGAADPFNINDAALAAANYLCVAGGNLRTDAGQRKAVLAYNHSDSYVNEVLALARAYASGIPVADIPLVGDTTGAVPAPGAYGTPRYYGPANPGPAIGARDMTPASGPTTGASASGGAPSGSAAPADSGSGSTPPPASGDGGSGTQPPAIPAGSGSTGGGSTGGTGTTGGSGGGTAPAVPGTPVPIPPAPAPVPAPPAAPTPPGELIPGVTCTLLGPLGQKLTPELPECP